MLYLKSIQKLSMKSKRKRNLFHNKTTIIPQLYSDVQKTILIPFVQSLSLLHPLKSLMSQSSPPYYCTLLRILMPLDLPQLHEHIYH